MPKVVDYVGRRFNMLVAVERAPNTKQGASAWWCTCDCGKKRVYARSTDLRRGDSQSCGCATGALISKANAVHGMSRTKVYAVWRAMLQRCENPKAQRYSMYGARGIRVCKRWHVFENFYADMGPPPKGRSIERKNNDGNYTPSNCYWATAKEQAANLQRTRRLTYAGRTMNIAEWARETKQPPLRIWQRLNRGWSVGDALTHPPIRGKVLHIAEE